MLRHVRALPLATETRQGVTQLMLADEAGKATSSSSGSSCGALVKLARPIGCVPTSGVGPARSPDCKKVDNSVRNRLLQIARGEAKGL